MLEKIENLIDQYYDINEDIDDLVFEELLKFAQTDREGFINYVNSQEFGPNSNRAILYESIMDDASGWEDFLLDQIKLIIEQSELGNQKAETEIFTIFYLTNIGGLKSDFYKDAIEFFKSKLYSSNKIVKRAALEYIIDLHSDGKLYLDIKLRKMLQEQLYDKEYTTRFKAFVELGEANLLPKEFKQKIIDRILTKFNLNHWRSMKYKKIAIKIVNQHSVKNNL